MVIVVYSADEAEKAKRQKKALQRQKQAAEKKANKAAVILSSLPLYLTLILTEIHVIETGIEGSE
jgi:Flp pilus assembly protein TadB